MAICPQVSRQSGMSANATDDNEGNVHRFPAVYRMAEKDFGSCQLGHSLLKAVRTVIASNGVLPPNDVGRNEQHIKK